MSDERPAPGAGSPRDGGAAQREAAACIERGIERYAEGAYELAQRELEAALAVAPGHSRAVECLVWIRELAAGRQSLQSGTYASVHEEQRGDSVAMPLPPGPAAPDVPRQSPLLHGSSQIDETPDSVTREWSTLQTGHFPQLDVPELSEEQIANLLEMDGGRGFTLSKDSAPARPSARSVPVLTSTPALEDENDADEADRTNIRLADANVDLVVEFVAEAEDPTPLPNHVMQGIVADDEEDDEPITLFPGVERHGQTSFDPPSMVTNPFVRQHLSELAGPFLASPVDELPSFSPTEPSRVVSAATVETALGRGELRDAFAAADQLADGPGMRTEEELAIINRACERLVGDLGIVPRYGKATSNLDSRSAFLLSRMDGAMSADDLLDVSGMPRADALRMLARLVASGAVLMTKE